MSIDDERIAKVPSPIRTEVALTEPRTQWRFSYCESVAEPTDTAKRFICHEVLDIVGKFGGHPEEASCEESEMVIDRGGGISVERWRRIGSRNE